MPLQIQTGLYLETQPGAFYFTGTGGVLRRANPPFYSCLCFVLFRLHHNRQRLTQNQWNLFLFVINSLRAVGRPQKVLGALTSLQVYSPKFSSRRALS